MTSKWLLSDFMLVAMLQSLKSLILFDFLIGPSTVSRRDIITSILWQKLKLLAEDVLAKPYLGTSDTWSDLHITSQLCFLMNINLDSTDTSCYCYRWPQFITNFVGQDSASRGYKNLLPNEIQSNGLTSFIELLSIQLPISLHWMRYRRMIGHMLVYGVIQREEHMLRSASHLFASTVSWCWLAWCWMKALLQLKLLKDLSIATSFSPSSEKIWWVLSTLVWHARSELYAALLAAPHNTISRSP